MNSAIEICNITRKYQLKDETIIAINNLSYVFEYGKLYVVMGHSGSGKSTLIQCLGLLDRITNGQIFINGTNINMMSCKQKNKFKNTELGFVFQNYYLNNTMKAYENVMLPMLINEKFLKLDLKDRAKKLLYNFGLENRLNHYPKELSGGEQQRVAIARAIANNPNIILADEPTGNLDEENEKYILMKLKEMASQGKCVIVVSHNNIVKKYADVILNMKNGSLSVEKNDV